MIERDCVLGSIVGGAIGDALGGPYEGQVGPVELAHDEELRVSDDTQLTLATCEAIVKNGEASPEGIAATFAEYFRDRRITGIGASTLKALTELMHGGHWSLVGAKGEYAAGNGAAMRAAPLAFCLDPIEDTDRATIRYICRITHHNDEAYVGALAVVIAVRAAMNKEWAGGVGLLDLVRIGLPDSVTRDRIGLLLAQQNRLTCADASTLVGCSGYVADSVPLALFAATQLDRVGFERMLQDVIRCGGDTDTIASMAGQIVGAAMGYDALPRKLIHRLTEREWIHGVASRFAEFVSQ